MTGFFVPTNGVTDLGGGVRLPSGHVIPTHGNVVAYVRSGGTGVSQFPQTIQTLGVTTLNAGLARVSNAGDIVVVMADHAENISSADQMDNLVAGTVILGMGHGAFRPTFTWTATGATFLLDVNNVWMDNLILQMADSANSGVTVTTPITVSGSGCAITRCRINFGDDANDNVGQAINTTAAADDFVFAHNKCISATAAECETMLNLIGTDNIEIVGNYIAGATSAVAVGLVRAETTASLNVTITDNVVINRKAASEEAITLMNGCTGYMDRNLMQVLDDATIEMDNNGDLCMGNDNYIANLAGERGVQIGTVSAAT